MTAPAWPDAVDQLRAFFVTLSDVQALGVFGSATHAVEHDAWSDIDAVVVVADVALARFHPAVDWLAPLGDLFTYEQSTSEHSRATRCVFADGRRLDLVFTTVSAVQRLAAWPSVAWWRGISIVFARTATVRDALVQPVPAPQLSVVSPETIEALLRGFWFKGVLAVTKVVRGDLLIALHLVLDLQRDCAVLGMLLRDRMAGTTIHRSGGRGNAVAAQLDATRAPFSATGILTSIEQCSVLCDHLATKWNNTHREQRGPLLTLIAKARATLGVEKEASLDTTSFRRLFGYNVWANARVLSAAAQLTPARFAAPAALSHGGVRGTLVHVLGTEWMWRQRYQQGVSPPALPEEAAYPTIEDVQQWAAEEAAAMRSYLASLDGAALAAPVHYTNTHGMPFATPLWEILTHVVNHGTQFRAEAAVALTQYGHSPGDLDFIAFVRAHAQEANSD